MESMTNATVSHTSLEQASPHLTRSLFSAYGLSIRVFINTKYAWLWEKNLGDARGIRQAGFEPTELTEPAHAPLCTD